MRHLDRDLRLTAVANLLYALGVGMYLQLLYVYAMDLGASRFTVGLLNALVIVSWTAGLLPGAWAARRFRLKPVVIGVWWLTVPAGLCFFLAPSWPWLIPGLVLSGTVLLLLGRDPLVWGLAMVCCGAFESLRLVAAGMVNDSFHDLPTAWGFAIFDTVMGLPMAAGAVVGGLLFRAGYALPFVVVIVISAALLALLVVQRRRSAVHQTVDARGRASHTGTTLPR